MTINDLKRIINGLPEDAVIQLQTEDIYEVESVHVVVCDGVVHLLFIPEE